MRRTRVRVPVCADDREDRETPRELARERNDGTLPELPSTPPGLYNTAADGTPRSAKAAGAELRKLTWQLYEPLMDPRLYGVTDDELSTVVVQTKFWDLELIHGRREYDVGERLLQRYNHGRRKRHHEGWAEVHSERFGWTPCYPGRCSL